MNEFVIAIVILMAVAVVDAALNVKLYRRLQERSANDGTYAYTACEATIGEILNRLTEYEDTGMAPEEIEDMKWNNEWHDARECTPVERGVYWVTFNENGMRNVRTAEFKADWIVDDVETIEAWMPMQKLPDLYERRE